MSKALAPARCALRHLRLLVAASPKTPLRVLCIIALDTVHALRHSYPIPQKRIRHVAEFIDFQACTNAMWDRKPLCPQEYSAIRRRLETAGLEAYVLDYLGRLQELESWRPRVCGAPRNFEEVRVYREAVARVSLAAVAAVAFGSRLEHESRAIHQDSHMNTLFRIVMQCQVVDDILDYRHDLGTGLPSFLTATRSRAQAMGLTATAARSYFMHSPRRRTALPFRLALSVMSILTMAVIRLALGPKTESSERHTATLDELIS